MVSADLRRNRRPGALSEALGFRAHFVEAHRARIGMGGSWLIGPEQYSLDPALRFSYGTA